MNTLLNAMKQVDNVTLTENGGVTYKSTMNGLMDLFALGLSLIHIQMCIRDRIKAGSKSNSTGAITGYRQIFLWS